MPGYWKKNTDKTIFRFFVHLVLVVLVFVSAIYLGIFLNNRQAMDEQLVGRGRSIVETIVFARNWNARHGGVFVEKTPEIVASPFLADPDIETRDGALYTLKNPSLMIREISEMITGEGTFQFHMASRKPLNPANAPDDFENRALLAFERGDTEAFVKEEQNGSILFRYMAPLFVEASCLECHARQGYGLGDVRGGISVRFSIDSVEAAQRKNLYLMAGLAAASFFFLAIIIHRLVRHLRRRLQEAEAKLRQMAVTDELTGLHNRRYLMQRLAAEVKRMGREQQPLACISFDLDHFKKVNDTYGHPVGDLVLKEVAAAAQRQCRESDILSRSGGEEFMVILPGTDAEGARHTAERLRQAIGNTPIVLDDGRSLNVSASFGVAVLDRGPGEGTNAGTLLLKHADDALYQAKAKGRNRVECARRL